MTLIKPWKDIVKDYDDSCLLSNGYPISSELLINIEEVIKRTYLNPRHLPSIIVIDGASGLGKTTLAYVIASILEGQEVDWDLQRSIGIKEFLKKALGVIKAKKKVIIYDEAGDFERKATNTLVSRDLNRFFELYRTFAIVPIIVLPSFLKLDSGLFINKIPRLLIHLYRGDDDYSYYKGYSLVGMMKLRHYFYYNRRYLPIIDDLFHKIEPNFTGVFKKPPDAVIKLIDGATDEGKVKELEKLFLRAEAREKSEEELFKDAYIDVRPKLSREKSDNDSLSEDIYFF